MRGLQKKQCIYAGMGLCIWAAACFVFFQFFYPDHLFYQEQNQIFLMSGEYISTYFEKPAWLACLTGDFLTQFFYYVYAGAAIVSMVILATGLLMWHALRRCGIKRLAFLTAMVLMAVLIVFHFDIFYRLPSDIAVAGGILVFIIFDTFRRHITFWHNGLYLLLLVTSLFLSYWTFGIGCWMTALLFIISAFMQKTTYRWVSVLSLPIIIISAITVSNRHYRLHTTDNLTYPGLGRLSAPDFMLERELHVDNEYYFGNYNRVVNFVRSQKQPTPSMSFFYNLCMARIGELPDHIFDLNTTELGTLYTIGPETPILVIKRMNELYYLLGDMTFTERAAMMGNVFSRDNRNVRMIRRLAEANLVSGDTVAANKYLRLLKKTIVHKKWAERHTPGSMTPEVKSEIANKQKYLNKTDTLQVGDNMHMMMTELIKSNPDNIAALDYTLCTLLLLKDIKSFKRDYDLYCMNTGHPRTKSLYQQALMIYLAGTNAPQEEWDKYISNQALLQRFHLYNQHRGDPSFSDSYWYFFDKGKAAEY